MLKTTVRRPPLRVALLCSHRAPGLHYLLYEDPDYGRTYEVVVCLSSEADSSAQDETRRAGIPFVAHPIRAFHRQQGAPLADRDARRAYDRETLRLLGPSKGHSSVRPRRTVPSSPEPWGEGWRGTPNPLSAGTGVRVKW